MAAPAGLAGGIAEGGWTGTDAGCSASAGGAGLGSVVEGGGVGVGRRRAAHAWGEDEFCRCLRVALLDDHIAAGAVEQGG